MKIVATVCHLIWLVIHQKGYSKRKGTLVQGITEILLRLAIPKFRIFLKTLIEENL